MSSLVGIARQTHVAISGLRRENIRCKTTDNARAEVGGRGKWICISTASAIQ
jgi:hypothetical protein